MNAVSVFLLVLCCLVGTGAWRCTPGPRLNNAHQIDAGQGKVVAVDSSYYPYFLMGSSWHRMTTTRVRHVSVGPAGLWAAGSGYQVYKWIGGHFRAVAAAALSQLDAGGLGQLVGVERGYNGFCLRDSQVSAFKGVGSLSWSHIVTSQRYKSCSPRSGCWAADRNYRVYYTQVINPSNCGVSGRRIISGHSMKVIEVSTDGSVFGVATNGRIYQRTGISSSVPYGTTWTEVPLCMTALHVSYDLGTLWVVTTARTIMKCTH